MNPPTLKFLHIEDQWRCELRLNASVFTFNHTDLVVYRNLWHSKFVSKDWIERNPRAYAYFVSVFECLRGTRDPEENLGGPPDWFNGFHLDEAGDWTFCSMRTTDMDRVGELHALLGRVMEIPVPWLQVPDRARPIPVELRLYCTHGVWTLYLRFQNAQEYTFGRRQYEAQAERFLPVVEAVGSAGEAWMMELLRRLEARERESPSPKDLEVLQSTCFRADLEQHTWTASVAGTPVRHLGQFSYLPQAREVLEGVCRNPPPWVDAIGATFTIGIPPVPAQVYPVNLQFIYDWKTKLWTCTALFAGWLEETFSSLELTRSDRLRRLPLMERLLELHPSAKDWFQTCFAAFDSYHDAPKPTHVFTFETPYWRMSILPKSRMNAETYTFLTDTLGNLPFPPWVPRSGCPSTQLVRQGCLEAVDSALEQRFRKHNLNFDGDLRIGTIKATDAQWVKILDILES